MRYVLAMAALCAGVAIGQELPEDTNEITTLTVEQAKELAKREGDLHLNSLTTLSDEAAQELARFKGSGLYLPNVAVLSDEAAQSLGQFKGDELDLSGVTELSDEAAQSLAAFRGKSLGLFKLAQVSKKGQDSLAAFAGALSLSDIAALDSATLARKQRGQLDKFSSVADEAAEAILEMQGERDSLYLPELRSLTHAGLARKLIASDPGFLHQRIRRLTEVSPEAATEIVSSPQNFGTLYFESLRELSPEVAGELAKFKGRLIFGSVTSLSDEAAKALGQHEGGVSFDRLESLTTAELAKVIVASAPVGTLAPNVRELSDEAAAALAERTGFSLRDFPALTELKSPALARSLFASVYTWDGRHPATERLVRISPEVAKAISECKQIRPHGVSLDGLRDLDADTARALAGVNDYLSLNGLTAMSPQVASKLARHTGPINTPSLRTPGLSLNGLKTISEEVAKALATHAGPVSMEGLEWETLSEGTKAIVTANPQVLIISK